MASPDLIPPSEAPHPLANISLGPWRLDQGDGERMAILDGRGYVVVSVDTRDFEFRKHALAIARHIVRCGPPRPPRKLSKK